MAEDTKIEWCDVSKSPWEGCTKVSPGCLNCYAEARDRRHLHEKASHWGKGAPRWKSKTFAAEMRKLNKMTGDGHCPCGVTWAPCAVEHSKGQTHFSGCKGSITYDRISVFPSLCDWLDAEVPIEWLAEFLQLIYETPNLDWLLLTKRPENWRTRLEQVKNHTNRGEFPSALWAKTLDWLDGRSPANVRIGASVEDQPRADERIPALLKIPAKVRLLSLEPLLGPVNLDSAWCVCGSCGECTTGEKEIHWLIIGGESGPNARPCNVEWIFSLVKQGKDAGVRVFVKQLGSKPVGPCNGTYVGDPPPDEIVSWKPYITHPKGGDPSEWPRDLEVREFPRSS